MSAECLSQTRPTREDRSNARLGRAARVAGLAALALAIAAAATLWASEGARVFAEAAFSAMLACL